MSSTERWIIGLSLAALFSISLSAFGWLFSAVWTNTGRIAVLEQRTNNHMKAMEKLDQDIERHRQMTERNVNK